MVAVLLWECSFLRVAISYKESHSEIWNWRYVDSHSSSMCTPVLDYLLCALFWFTGGSLAALYIELADC